MRPSFAACAMAAGIAASAFMSHAAPQKTGSVLNSGGGRSAGDAYELTSAVGQPSGADGAVAGSLINYAGFFGTFSLQPGLDSDKDGIEDELDDDNDNDGLTDEEEITGSAHNDLVASDPNDHDSDKDGADDGDESAAGTNPMDGSMYLHFTEILCDDVSGEVLVEWMACGAKTYEVYYLDDMTAGPGSGTHLADVPAYGGAGPWLVTYTNLSDTGPGSAGCRYYYLRLKKK